MSTATFSGICEKLGTPLRNTRWSWCALSPDGKRAIFTLWQDKFEGRRYPLLYHKDRDKNDNPNRPGWVEITNVVRHCLTNPETEVLGVLCKARQPIEDPRVREWVDGRELLVLSISVDAKGNPWAEIIGLKSRATCVESVETMARILTSPENQNHERESNTTGDHDLQQRIWKSLGYGGKLTASTTWRYWEKPNTKNEWIIAAPNDCAQFEQRNKTVFYEGREILTARTQWLATWKALAYFYTEIAPQLCIPPMYRTRGTNNLPGELV